MSKITSPIVTDETAKQIVEKLHTQNALLGVIAGANLEQIDNIKEIHSIVQSGKAADVFSIGDQITVPWTDVSTGRTYLAVHDVVRIGNAELADGEEVPALFLQWHYATPFGVQFDAREAFYCAKAAALAAGTYKFTLTEAYGKATAGTYQFTLTKNLPQNGVLVFNTEYAGVDSGLVNATISSYASASSTEVLETVTVTSGTSGTSLGNFVPAGSENLRSIQIACYGYNRWSQSAIRQWLNSNAAVNGWWTPKNDYDRPPVELTTKAGFMSGYGEDFLECVNPIKLKTALNTVTDNGITSDNLEVTYDTFFLPSLVNMHIAPQLAGEGEVFEYWARVSQSENPLPTGGTYPQLRTFAIENHNSPQYVRLRSAGRGSANGTWLVHSSGHVSYYIAATTSFRCAPVCAIC